MATRKKYNPIKSATNQSKVLLRNKCVVYIAEVTPAHVLHDYKINEMAEVNRKLDFMLRSLKQNWSIEIAVFLRHKNGQEEYISETVAPPMAVTHDQIQRSCHVRHLELIEEVKSRYPKNICGAGWIGVPRDVILSENKCKQIFEMYGAFSLRAPWEGN